MARPIKAGPGFGLIFVLMLACVSAFGQQDPQKRGGPDASDNPSKRAAWFLRGRTVQGRSAAELLRRAHQQKLQIRQQTLERIQQRAAQMSQTAPASGTASTTTTSGTTSATAPGGGTPMTVPQPSSPWANLGPAPITGNSAGTNNFGFSQNPQGNYSGRITAVAVDQSSNGNTVYVGGAYGGVWKSTNAAASDPTTVTWTPLYDTDPAAATLSVGAITLQPTNGSVILVGTGEPNNALDSYYGMGILRSTNGGVSWSLITSGNSGANPFKGMGVSKFAWKPDGSVVVAGFSNGTNQGEVNAGSGGFQGIYYSTDAGATWTKAANATAGDTVFGSVSDVVYVGSAGNTTVNKFFAYLKRQGVYSSPDGATWTRLANQPFTLGLATCSNNATCNTLRGQLTVRPGTTDMYVWGVNYPSGTTDLGISKTSNGGSTAWAAFLTGGMDNCGDNFGGCGTSQGFYDLVLSAVPNGANTDLYAGAVNLFKCQVNSTTNPTCTNFGSWLNLTHVYSTMCASTYVNIHPDQHGIDFLQSNPNIIYFGNDGGMYRSLTASTGLNSGSCSGTGNTGNAFQDLNTSSLGSLTQFISISQHPTKDTIVLGGTQDNGSPGMSTGDGQTSGTEWAEANGGDGGYNEIDPVDPKNWYTANTDVSIQKCVGGTRTSGLPPLFPNADPESACILNDFFNPVVTVPNNFPDHGDFYTPYILDPQLPSRLIIGTCRVWRGNADGTSFGSSFFGSALSDKLNAGNTGNNIACSTSESAYVSALAAGGPLSVNNGAKVIYAGTSGRSGGGHIWVTTNATTGQATWTDQTGGINPNGFPISKIAIDTTDATGKTAYITIMGFTGFLGGHVFKTTNAGVSWTDISAGLPDAPADSVAIDPIDHTIIYVGTDVGVFATNDPTGATWNEYGTGLPNVATVALRAFSSGNSHKLRVGTHGRGVWEIDLAGSVTPDFSLNISNPTLEVPPGFTGTLNGKLVAHNGYVANVTISCDATPGPLPGTCTPPGSPVTPTASPGTDYAVSASNPSLGTFNFSIKGVGADANTITHETPVTLKVTDFTIGSVSTAQTIPQGGSGTYTVTVTSQNGYGGTVDLSCANFSSAGVSCSSITPNDFVPAGAGTNVTVTLSAAGNAAVASNQTFDVVADDGTTSHKVTRGYNVVLVQDFTLTGGTTSQTIIPGATGHFTATLTPLNQFSDSSTTLSCSGLPAGAACVFTPASGATAAIGSGTPLPLAIDITTTNGTTPPATSNVTVTASGTDINTSTFRTHSIQLTLAVQDFSLSVTPSTQSVQPGTDANYTVSIATTSSFPSSPALTCAVLTAPAGTSCAFDTTPLAPGNSTTLRVHSDAVTTPDGSYTLRTTATSGAAVHTQDVTYVVSRADFTLATSTPTKSTSPGTLTSYKLTVTATGSFASSVTLSCANLPANVSCFAVAPFTPSPSGTNTTMTLSVGSSAVLGTYQFQINGSGGGKSHSLPITLIISTLNLTNSTPSKTVQVGSSTTFSLSLSSTGSSSPGTVTMSCVGPLPTGVGCSFVPASLTPTSTATAVTATVTTTTSTPAGSYILTFQGATNSQSVQVTGTLNAADFSVAVSPSSQTIASTGGGSTSYTVTLTALNGVAFPSAVTPSCTGLPTGWTCGFSVNPVTPTTGGANTTLTLTTTSTPTGSTTITVQGASGSLIHTQTTQVINGLDYTLSAAPNPVTVQEGSSNTTTISATTVGGFASAITLSCAPNGITPVPGFGTLSCTGFSGNPFTPPGGSSVLTLSATADLTPGVYTVTVSGTGGGITHTKNVTVNVPDFTVGLTGASSTVFRGQSLGLNGTATAIAGFASSVTFTCSTGDANAPCVASSPVTPTGGGAAVTVTVSPNGSATLGAHTVTLSGDDGAGHQHSATFGITVQDFAVAATDTDPSVEAGSSATYNTGTLVTGQSGFTGNVAMSCTSGSGSLIISSCVFTPNPVAASGPGTSYSVQVNTDPASTPGGPYTVHLTGTVGSATRTADVTLTVTPTVDFSLSASPPSQTINAGGSATVNLTLTSINGFGSAVTITCSVVGSPAGTGCTPPGGTVTPTGGGAASSVTVTSTSGTVAAGTYSVTVTGTGGGKTHSQTVSVTVRDFSLSVTPSTQTVQAGTDANYNVSLATASGFPSSPALTCAVLTAPAGTSCAFDTTPLAPGSSTTLRVHSTAVTTPDGSYTLRTTATSGATVHTQDVTYVVSSSDFTLTTSTPSKSAAHGTLTSYKLTVTATGSFASSVTLSCSNLPANVSCFSVASFVPSTSGTNTAMTLNVGSAAIPGTYQFNINASGGGKTHFITVTLTIT